MLTEPLFQPDILNTMLRYFAYYFSYQNWIYQYLGAMLVIYGFYKFVTYKNVVTYPKFFPDALASEPFQKHDWLGIIFLLFCLAVYMFALYSQEMSFFQNYDTMATGTTLTLKRGIKPMFATFGRFAPVAFWEVNCVYAVTRNFYLIHFFILLQTLFILFLTYHLLDFWASYKRIFICGLFLISPAFFWVNNIIFPERMLLIYFISSLIFLKKYNREPQKSYFLFLGILFANFAIYTKESTILVYFGILAYFFLYDLWNEKITIKSFIHPITSIKQFPFEILLFISMLIYSFLYSWHVDLIIGNPYLVERKVSSFELILRYKFEVFTICTACLMWLLKGRFCKSAFLLNALLLGSVCQITVLVFLLHVGPDSVFYFYINKTYYCLLAYFIALVYVFGSLKNKPVQILFSAVICIYSFFISKIIYNVDEGKYHRELSSFLSSQAEPISVYIAKNSELSSSFWFLSCWLSIYKHYWPDLQIQFFSPHEIVSEVQENLNTEVFHPIKFMATPQKGHFYVVKHPQTNLSDKEVLKNMDHEKVFSNQIFEVYQIK